MKLKTGSIKLINLYSQTVQEKNVRIHKTLPISGMRNDNPSDTTDIKRISSVQLLSHIQLFVTPWTTARQASLSITNYSSLLKLTSIESVTPSNHLILCHPLLLLPSIFSSVRVFSMSQLFAAGG